MVDSETASAAGRLIDSTVGSVVWVRRRNGSWWPGKILGPDDLSSSLKTSSRSGTPVKLLGREDACVDWYNLEKSKRVKSFRCGEFDECIERAEAAQGTPPQKREKYARREDAISHALELEKQMLEKKYMKFGYPSDGKYKKLTCASTSGEHMEQGCGNLNSARSDQISDRLTEKSVADVRIFVEKGREECQVSRDDDSPGAPPRMRGLQDFGLLTAPPSQLRPKYPVRTETFKQYGSMGSSDDFDSFTSTDDASHPSPSDPVPTEMSKWQLKGKRNNRVLGKRAVGITDRDISRGYVNGKTSNWNNNCLKAHLASKSGNRIARHGTGGLKGSDYDYMDIDGLTRNIQSGMREYWEDLHLQEHGDTVSAGRQHMRSRIMLVEVDLKVKANNSRRDVPMISLTSKLNGHLIIGHPIQIEVLESGSTDKLLQAAGYFSPESLESPTGLPPVRRTGRRTSNSHVPRPRFVDENKKLVFSSNSVKKTSPSSNQKIRTLSSILLEQKHHNNVASSDTISQVDGLIKTVPTAVACIPVNLVFSRLHEELIGRHH